MAKTIGTPGGSKGGAWGKPDSRPVAGREGAAKAGTPNVGKKPWQGQGSNTVRRADGA